MKVVRQFVTVLSLLAWLCAGVHVVLEHGGRGLSSPFGEAEHVGHHHHHHEGGAAHDHDAPLPGDGEDHQHDLGAVLVSQFAKTSDQSVSAPEWLGVYDRMVADCIRLLLWGDRAHEHSVLGDSPPDGRTSGWLLAVQTAQPVRGPSFAA